MPPISQGTGGDGHVPILVGSKVFAFFHHSSPDVGHLRRPRDRRSCAPAIRSRSTSATTDINGPGAVVGHADLRAPAAADRSATPRRAPIALFCWDAETDATCGLTIVDRVARTSNPDASAPVLVGGKMWFGGDTGKLYCVDPATGRRASRRR